jgi:hypothetical protein
VDSDNLDSLEEALKSENLPTQANSKVDKQRKVGQSILIHDININTSCQGESLILGNL